MPNDISLGRVANPFARFQLMESCAGRVANASRRFQFRFFGWPTLPTFGRVGVLTSFYAFIQRPLTVDTSTPRAGGPCFTVVSV